LAELSNKNLLTSRTAEINTKPELEIYADDVRCAHGATISQLNETSLFYLQSRGVSQAEAMSMLSFGFINELLNEVPEPAIQRFLRPRLAELFGRESSKIGQLAYD
jgi:Fe-S cluster assembly protein SufD